MGTKLNSKKDEGMTVDPTILAEMGVTAQVPAAAELKVITAELKTITAGAPLTPAVTGNTWMIGSVVVASQEEALALMISTANLLKEMMITQRLFTTFSDRKGNSHAHPHVEAWQVLAMLLGCTVRELDSRYTMELNGFESTAEVIRLTDGMRIGLGSGFCGFDEPGKEKVYASKSMSMTRAISKSVKNQWGHIMKIAGFQPTPKEEIEDDNGEPISGFSKQPQAQQALQPRPVEPAQSAEDMAYDAAQKDILDYGLLLKLTGEEVTQILIATFGSPEKFPTLPEQKDMYTATLHLAVKEQREVSIAEVEAFLVKAAVAAQGK